MEPDENSFDPEQRNRHIATAWRRMPGPMYIEVLGWLHSSLEPANYVEIGIHTGISLGAGSPATERIGIDPLPQLDRELERTRIYPMTSDEFFAQHDLDQLLSQPVQVAFIDGLHLFEQVLIDLGNLEPYCTSETVVALHDCLPLDEATASRERTTAFYSGDVWKAVMALCRTRDDLEIVMVPAPPTGLCLIRGLGGGRGPGKPISELIEDYRDLGYDYYEAHRSEMPPEIPDTKTAVLSWLERTATTAV